MYYDTAMIQLSTHILDTSAGHPATGVRIELHRINSADRRPVTEGVTNDDGRCVLSADDTPRLEAGDYELTFHVGDYFAGRGNAAPTPVFLDAVPVRFRMQDDQRYHVPLLISPYGYSTYRGS